MHKGCPHQGGGGPKIRKFCGRTSWKPPNSQNNFVAKQNRICSLFPKPKHLQSARGSVRERERVPISPSPFLFSFPSCSPLLVIKAAFLGRWRAKKGLGMSLSARRFHFFRLLDMGSRVCPEFIQVLAALRRKRGEGRHDQSRSLPICRLQKRGRQAGERGGESRISLRARSVGQGHRRTRGHARAA